MKKEIHPEYKNVIFKDVSCDFEILTRSTLSSDETMEWKDGNTYPLIKVQISSGSHPFFTGKQRVVDTAGRIDSFKKKFGDRVALGSQKKQKGVPFRAKKLETKKAAPAPEAKPEPKTEE